jgi:starvation-inducible DNA-binding protein
MFPTAISLNEKTRFEVCKLLQQLLSEATDLHQQMKFAHWNVRGLNFMPLHELFDKIAGDLDGISDDLAERIAQLGGRPDATIAKVAEQSELVSYPTDATSPTQHIEAVIASLGDFTNACRDCIEAADDLDDAVTSDLLTQITGKLDKQLWFVEAHQSE